MIRVLSLLLTLGVVTAVREDITANLQAEAEEEMEMKLVPAKISKAIRKSMRLTSEAMKVAEASKANATQMAEKAEKKASEAEQELQKANKMKDELEMGAKKLEEIKEDAQKKMESGKEAQAAWKKEKDALTALEKEYEAEDKKYGELAKKVEEEIKRLIQEKTQGNLKLAEMRKKKNLKGEEVEKLATETAAAGGIARSAQEAAEKADAKFKEAEKKCEAQKSLAEKAATMATTAQAEYGQAKDEASNAELEVQNRMAEKQQVLELRNSVQSYYDATDLMTKSMEASLAKLTGGEEESTKKPWDLMREDENVKKSMVSYNLMVGQFCRLFFENKDIYTLVAESTREIHENAQAAWLLQCDPEEELEEEWKKSGSVEKLNEHCGVGLWKHLGVERQNFPTKGETVPASETPVEEPKPAESVSETETEAPEPTEAPEAMPEATEAVPEATEEVNVEPKDEEEVHNAEPLEDEPNNAEPALLQAKDLALVRQIRRHRQREASAL